MKKQYLTYEQIIKRNNHKSKLIKNGFEFITKANPYKKIMAYVLIIYGFFTLPLPTGSVFCIGLGLAMLGLKPNYIKKEYKKIINYQKAKRKNN